MALIDDIARREDITKATVITRALDCMQASYDSGHGGMPITSAGGGGGGASEEELNDLRNQLKRAQDRVSEVERQLQDANRRADAAESRASSAASNLAAAQSASQSAAVAQSGVNAEAEAEIERLRELVSKQAATLEEKIGALAAKEVSSDESSRQLAAKEAELSSKDAIIADRDRQISSLRDQLGEANARIQLSSATPMPLSPVTFDTNTFGEDNPGGAISMLNMLNNVMGAFKQQVKDARILGEQEGRKAAQRDFQDIVNKARNDGYRDAMTYLDDRVTTAREAGAKEERARVANMSFFERRRYLRIHIT